MAHFSSSVTPFISRRLFLILLSLILLLAVGIRFVALGSIPTGLYVDEAAMLLDAKIVSETGMDMHSRPWYQILYPSYGDFKLPVYIWLASLSVTFFGVSELALRLPSAVAGVGTVVIAGLIARELGLWYQKPKVARILFLSTMLVITLSPWSMMFSRTAFEGHLAQFLLAFSVWLALKAKSNSNLILGSVLLGTLATYTYFSVRFVWPVVFSATSLLFLLDWSYLRSNLKLFLIRAAKLLILPIVLFSISLLPMLNSPLYEDSNRFRLSTESVLTNDSYVIQSNVYRELSGNTPVDRVLFHRSWLMMRELLMNYADHLSLNYLYLDGDQNLRHGTQSHGVFLLPFLPIFFFGLFHLFNTYRRVFFLVLCWWLIALLPASVPEETPHSLRSLNALVPLTLIHGYGLSYIFSAICRSRSQILKILGYLYAILVLVFFLSFVHFYFTQYPKVSADSWKSGYRELITSASSFAGDEPLYVLTFNDRFYLWLLLYREVPGSVIQNLPQDKYILSEVPGVKFIEHNLISLPRDKIIYVAGQVKEMERMEKELQGEVFETKFIKNSAGDTLFKVVKIKL